eukprot:10631752-Karenia_brevis.AAC.1
MPAAGALATGISQQEDLQCVVTWFHKLCAEHNVGIWIEWVPSEDNLADGPSRGVKPEQCEVLEIPHILNSRLQFSHAWSWFCPTDSSGG